MLLGTYCCCCSIQAYEESTKTESVANRIVLVAGVAAVKKLLPAVNEDNVPVTVTRKLVLLLLLLLLFLVRMRTVTKKTTANADNRRCVDFGVLLHLTFL